MVTKMHWTLLASIALKLPILNYTELYYHLHYTGLYYPALHCILLPYIAMYFTTLHSIVLYYPTLHWTLLPCNALDITSLHCAVL